ncbi:DNA polymerase III subunit gamma/tau, partial [Pseudothauera nasutitermitis]
PAPQAVPAAPPAAPMSVREPAPQYSPSPAPAAGGAQEPAPTPAVQAPQAEAAVAAPVAETPRETADVPPWEDLPPEAFEGLSAEPAARPAPAPVAAEPARVEAPPAAPAVRSAVPAGLPDGNEAWHALLRELGLGGMVRELAQHCEWLGEQDGQVRLRLSSAHRHLLDMTPAGAERLQEALGAHLGRALRIRVDIGEIADATPAQRDQAEKRARHVQAVAALEADPFVRELIERFDATLLEETVRPL